LEAVKKVAKVAKTCPSHQCCQKNIVFISTGFWDLLVLQTCMKSLNRFLD